MEGCLDLPNELLYEITKKSLSAIYYFILGYVCRGWRSFTEEYKKEFVASQPPLALFFSLDAISFYSIFDQRLYKTILPSPLSQQHEYFGFTCGYLVFRDKRNRGELNSQLWLLHPFTRHELRFREPPELYNRVILARVATPPVLEFVLIAFCEFLPFFHVRRSTQTNWTQFDFGNIDWSIRDAIVFKGKTYVLTSEAKIGVLHLSPHLHVTLLNIGRGPYTDMNPGVQCLVSDGQRLMMVVSSLAFIEHTVYELDFVHLQWVMVKNFANEALFLGPSMGSGSCDLTGWTGIQQPFNSIYQLGSRNRKYIVSFLDERHYMSFPGNHMPNDSLFDPFWYFPHLSCNMDPLSLLDD